MAVATVKLHPDKSKEDFNAVVTFLSQCNDKKASPPSVKAASVGENKPTKWQKTSTTHGTFEGKIEWKKYSREEYDLMSMAQYQQL